MGVLEHPKHPSTVQVEKTAPRIIFTLAAMHAWFLVSYPLSCKLRLSAIFACAWALILLYLICCPLCAVVFELWTYLVSSTGSKSVRLHCTPVWLNTCMRQEKHCNRHMVFRLQVKVLLLLYFLQPYYAINFLCLPLSLGVSELSSCAGPAWRGVANNSR